MPIGPGGPPLDIHHRLVIGPDDEEAAQFPDREGVPPDTADRDGCDHVSLDEDALIDLYDKVRRARKKYVTLYRAQGRGEGRRQRVPGEPPLGQRTQRRQGGDLRGRAGAGEQAAQRGGPGAAPGISGRAAGPRPR